MGIQVEAEILRGSCTPVFFAGETLISEIRFNNNSNSNSSDNQTILWACAQIDCHCHIDESKVVLSKNPLRYNTTTLTNDIEIISAVTPQPPPLATAAAAASTISQQSTTATTSFQPNKDRLGISIYSSKPKILFCNLNLSSNQTKTFIYKETLPYDLVPTFRGQFAKYSYKLTIGVQKLMSATQLLRLPFRVYSLLDFERFILSPQQQPAQLQPRPQLSPTLDSLNEDLDVSIRTNQSDSSSLSSSITDITDKEVLVNPFKINQNNDDERLEYALQILEDITLKNTPSNASFYFSSRIYFNFRFFDHKGTFNVTTQNEKIVKIILNKNSFKIGDKIIGYLDFTDSQVSCIEVS
jgi:RAB6A-GEF complex partner protein 2